MDISNSMSACPSFPLCVQKLAQIPAVLSQNVTYKSFLISVKSEKYASLVTFRPLGSVRIGEAELRTLCY